MKTRLKNISECMVESMYALHGWRGLYERSKKEEERKDFHTSELEKLKQPEDNMKILAHRFCLRLGELNDDIRQVVDALEYNVVLQAVARRDILHGHPYGHPCEDFINGLHDVWVSGMTILCDAGLKNTYRVPPPPKIEQLDISHTGRNQFLVDNYIYVKELTSDYKKVKEIILDLDDIAKTISLIYTSVLHILRSQNEEE